ncbi:DUF3718 domain-containing protein [Agarilytica rhodophyticola]|uniref:DUF3718 domain-containing protein n=1 Tax=Agarilytica rhodophyticola TaxID=1737490 RepID=UPI000B345ABB|nr:DUF3718 domain-containing protein [Agarilytica rhodophyticola]
MKSVVSLTTGLITLAVLFTANVASADRAKTKYVYQGDEEARPICMAIAKNQMRRLKRNLDNRKVSTFDNKVHTRYSCNGKDLITFAEEIGAEKALQYLAKVSSKKQEKLELVKQ